MKFFAAASLFLGYAASASVAPRPRGHVEVGSVEADSAMGAKIMSKARRLENEQDVDFTWVAGYSIKFQGCHHITQWNDEAEADENGQEMHIQTKRLIRFRLCETDVCSATSASGCSSGYGDYIIDMNEFLEVYYDAVDEANEYACEQRMNNVCDCEDDDGKDDGFDRDICEYECYMAAGMDYCVENNPYEDDEAQQEKFELKEYVECKEVEFNNNDNSRRRAEEEEEIQYFVGPYCSAQGGSIYLGLFTDNTCSVFADTGLYEENMGVSLPYASQSVITMDCFSCKEPEDVDENNDGNDAQDGDEVIEMCEQIYAKAGKCESGLSAVVDSPNENACNYMAGIKVARNDGIITQLGSNVNKTASVFIGIFVVAFVLLAAYVYYLKTKLDRASVNLME